MTEPTEDEILLKAKQLARDDGRLWLWGPDGRGIFAEDPLRAEYLLRAREMLKHEKS